MDNKKKYFVADEGDGLLNAFSYDMFDKDGFLEGHKGEQGYHLDDYDIIAEFASWDAATKFVDDHES